MWYIQQKTLNDQWANVYSYYSDHYSRAKEDLEILRSKYSYKEFRLICVDNF